VRRGDASVRRGVYAIAVPTVTAMTFPTLFVVEEMASHGFAATLIGQVPVQDGGDGIQLICMVSSYRLR
jgi:hypothetical protein